MNFDDYISIAMQSYIKNKDDVRYGQHLMNQLTLLSPKIASSIPMDYDPYYDNSKVPNFLSYLSNNWNSLSN